MSGGLLLLSEEGRVWVALVVAPSTDIMTAMKKAKEQPKMVYTAMVQKNTVLSTDCTLSKELHGEIAVIKIVQF